MSAESLSNDGISVQLLPWQKKSVQRLVELKQQQRLPHAILVEVGTCVDSRSFGWYLVSALLCEKPGQDLLPCGSCKHCVLMRANNYPDFTFTTLEENDKTHKLNKDIKISQIRRLIHQLALTSNLKGGKLALIYPAEKMNQSAANSLLKTLEEPADQATLILLTHNAGKLPITIRSRCQTIALNNPDTEQALAWLTDQGIDSADIDDYLAFAGNDAQLALVLSEQGFIEHLKQFRTLLQDYLNEELNIVELINRLKHLDQDTLRLLVNNTITSCIHDYLAYPLNDMIKRQLGSLIDLTKHSNFTLQTEENNLNFQLQLEDVLISFKQIQNRGNKNGCTEPGHLVT